MFGSTAAFLLYSFILCLCDHAVAQYPVGYPPPRTSEDRECAQKSSCATWHDSTHAQKFLHANCYCDVLCQAYGDCCEDYRSHFPSHPNISRFPHSSFNCERISLKSESENVHMVNRCPEPGSSSSASQDAAHRYCHSTDTSDIFANWPVSDSQGVAFKNIFCAVCHGRNPDDVLYWSAEYSCFEVIDDLQTLMQNGTLKEHCRKARWEFPKGRTVRQCKPLTQTCSSNFPDTNTISQCVDGFTSMVYKWTQVYKNKHCAECNGRTGYSCIMPPYSGIERDLGTSFPMSVLLDLNSGSGTLTYESRVGLNQGKELKMQQCPERQVYDPFTRVCRVVGCATGYELIQGGCVGAGAQIRNSSCLSHVLNATEYTLLSSGELYVNVTGELLGEEDFEVTPDGSVLVCTNLSRNYTLEPSPIMDFKFDAAQTIVSVIGQVISLIALAIHFIVYLLLPSLRNLAGKMLMCLVASLFVAQFFFLVGIARSDIYGICFVLAVVIHFAFLASFFWMNAISVDIFRAFSKMTKAVANDQHHRLFIRYSAYAWAGPTVIVFLAIGLDMAPEDSMALPLQPRYGEGVCWITSRLALLAWFGVPVLIIVVTNTLLFALTIKNLCQVARDTRGVSKSSDRQRLLLSAKLSSIMGLTWLVGFLATWTEAAPLWYLFIVLNSLQGAFICLAFVCNGKTLRLLRGKLSVRKETRHAHGTGNTRSHSAAHSSSSQSANSTATQTTTVSDTTQSGEPRLEVTSQAGEERLEVSSPTDEPRLEASSSARTSTFDSPFARPHKANKTDAVTLVRVVMLPSGND